MLLPIKEALENLPQDPGVYLYYNAEKHVIYVGKAINLKNRVRSYFQKSENLGPKTQALVSNIAFMETIKVESEIEALLLEAELIKLHKPRYNIELKDDKSPIYIKITTNEEIPRISTVRREQLPGVTYFGPYPSSGSAKQVLRLLRRIFPYRSCQVLPKKPCLYYHLKLCDAPCVGHISPQDYQKRVKQIILFLQGKKKQLLRDLEKEMKQHSEELRFEQAAQTKSQIDSIHYVTQSFKNPIEYLENPNLVEDERQQTLGELAQALAPYLGQINPQRIECYDISNIHGTNAVGAMTVATEGEINKREYRKFKIRLPELPNDFAMMQEMLRRRLKHDEWPMPDLIIIDGGKGQVTATLQVMAESGKNIPLVGLAKRIEEIVIKTSDGYTSVVLPRNSKALHLIQRLRDEAHRFGITYHRLLRSKNQTGIKKGSKAKEKMRK